MSEGKHLKLIALFFIALLLFNYPIISIFSTSKRTLGLPSLFLYMFVAWFIVIILTRWIITVPKADKSDRSF